MDTIADKIEDLAIAFDPNGSLQVAVRSNATHTRVQVVLQGRTYKRSFLNGAVIPLDDDQILWSYGVVSYGVVEFCGIRDKETCISESSFASLEDVLGERIVKMQLPATPNEQKTYAFLTNSEFLGRVEELLI